MKPRVAEPDDFARFGAIGISSADARRLHDGSLCLWIDDVDGEPAAALWLSGTSHQDQHFGEWTRPTSEMMYGDSLYVRPDLHGQGLGTQLLCAALHHANTLGYSRLRGMVDMRNEPSVKLHRRLGYIPVARLYGLKLGSRYLRVSRPVHS